MLDNSNILLGKVFMTQHNGKKISFMESISSFLINSEPSDKCLLANWMDIIFYGSERINL